ncbi:hypothetical protein [Fimbriiglobus ruber]|uniref:Uncharacterized protein n=1 Tax=Fimbriiglobus ruber TaxID=1908690 RepID=A0A225DD20_9BACT|nr:hypothetical protein [Fimbriiglobus ruber]OWK34305.1 hypothetical protein FRUB_10276 [Fimbriiglobus ruber]
MSTQFNDLSLVAYQAQTIVPQSISGNTNGTAVNMASVGPNVGNMLVSVGAVNTFTSVTVKVQQSADGSTGWTDITNAVGTAITAANSVQIVPFQNTTGTYNYVRAVATLVGTSCLISVVMLAEQKIDQNFGFQNGTAQPPAIN